jgi:DNA-binding response OmpR family regulator
MHTTGPDQTVLIIEPDAITAELYRRELSRRFRVLTCPTATSGAAIISREALCAVVLEPLGAEASADVVSTVLAKHTYGQALPLIICSVLDDPDVSRALGAKRHLVKPVLPATLLATVSSLCPPEYRERGEDDE